MARGGRRVGRQGANYSNRSDLQNGPRLPVQAPSGQAYGERGAQEASLRAVPLLRPASPAGQAGQAPAAGSPLASPPPGPLDGPTNRPDEPLTAGSAYGSGPGPEVLGLGQDTTADELRALYRAYPNEDLRALVEALDGR